MSFFRFDALRSRKWFLLVVVLPTLLAAIYYGLIASDQYVSQSSFVIRSPTPKPGQVSTLANLIQTTGLSAGKEQTDDVLAYIDSRAALADLEKHSGVRARFMSQDADWLSRYPLPWHHDRFETLYQYYLSMVDAHVDNDTGVAEVSVKAFTPQDAHDLNAELLDLSEGLVNRLNERAQQRIIGEDESRVANAEARVRGARETLGQYRNAEQLIDPVKQATGVLDISAKLISEQASLRAQLDLMRRVAPQNPQIPSLESHIGAIGQEIATQNGRAVGTRSGIASKLGGYENLAMEQEFSTQALTAANTALETAQADAQKQEYYLERVVEPNTPDLALLPARFRMVVTVAAVSLCIYLIGWMLVVGILEHAPED